MQETYWESPGIVRAFIQNVIENLRREVGSDGFHGTPLVPAGIQTFVFREAGALQIAGLGCGEQNGELLQRLTSQPVAKPGRTTRKTRK
jgi:hypothetical protein